ncbi:MAG: glycosyltransferase, partial [Phycisphaerae bacterium]
MRRRVAVSVVLPVHNGAAFLRPSIESVLEQTCGDFELIVIDDGSTDATPELLAEYAARDRRVSIQRHETNQGLCAALNRGLAAATGRYIARQDADDVCFQGRLEAQKAYLDDHTDVGLLGAGRIDVDARGLPARSCLYPPTDTGIRWRMLLHNPFCHTAVMFRRGLLEREPEGYRAAYLYAEDYDLWTRLLKHTRGANLQEPLVLHRLHQASISMKRQADQERLSTAIAAGQIAALGIDPPVTEPLVG